MLHVFTSCYCCTYCCCAVHALCTVSAAISSASVVSARVRNDWHRSIWVLYCVHTLAKNFSNSDQIHCQHNIVTSVQRRCAMLHAVQLTSLQRPWVMTSLLRWVRRGAVLAAALYELFLRPSGILVRSFQNQKPNTIELSPKP